MKLASLSIGSHLLCLFALVVIPEATNAQTTPSPSPMKSLSGQPTRVTASERISNDELTLSVTINAERRDPEPLKLSEILVRAFDQHGIEIAVSPLYPKVQYFTMVMGSAYDASYVLKLKQGQRLVNVKLSRGRDTQQFEINEVRKGIKDLPGVLGELQRQRIRDEAGKLRPH